MAYSAAVFHIDPVNGNDAVRNTIAIASSTNTNPIQITTAVAHGLSTNDRVNITGHLVNTNANGTYTITYVNTTAFTLNSRAGNGVGVATGSVYKKPIESSTNTSPIEITATAHGLVTGAVVTITGHLLNTNAVGVWKITYVDANHYTLDGSIGNGTGVATGYVVPFGGMNWADAWKTTTLGATAARIAPDDEIRFAKSPSPVSIGNGKWTAGPIPATQIPTSSTNASPIVVTKTGGHGYANGDVIRIIGHGVNTAANGANGTWFIANVTSTTFELVGSTGNGIGGATGTMQNINARCVVLNSAQTATIDLCETAWTAANGSTVTALAAIKQGVNCARIQWPATPLTAGTKYAYKTISLTDYSSYQKLSLWFYSNLLCAAGTWKICLCSDTTGDTIVDTFLIPFVSVTPTVFALNRVSGGNLGSSIQSIALYCDTASPTSFGATTYLALDNIIACTTDGLSLRSLISINSNDAVTIGQTDGDFSWYSIQSIVDTLVVLDSHTGAIPGVGRGYSSLNAGSSTVATYKRESFGDAPMAYNIIINTINESGTPGHYISFIGGWNTSTNLQDGTTYFDTLSSYGVHFSITSKSFLKFRSFGCVRGQTGFNMLTIPINNIEVKDVFINCITTALQLSGASGIRYENLISSCCGSAASGALVIDAACSNIICKYLYIVGCLGSPIFGAGQLNIDTFVNVNNGINGFSYDGKLTLYEIWMDQSLATILSTQNEIYVSSSHMGTLVTTGINQYGAGVVSMPGQIRVDGATMEQNNSIRHVSQGYSWKTTITGNWRTSTFPIELSLVKMPVNANTLATVRAWIKKDTASAIGAALFCKGGQLSGVNSDITITKANDTNWEELTLTFTPTEKGVIEIKVRTWYISGTLDSTYCTYVHDLSMMQG